MVVDVGTEGYGLDDKKTRVLGNFFVLDAVCFGVKLLLAIARLVLSAISGGVPSVFAPGRGLRLTGSHGELGLCRPFSLIVAR